MIKINNKTDFKICVIFQKSELLIDMDYTFLMEDDIYIHIEFQTRDKVKANLTTFKAGSFEDSALFH
ncbi:hypothetical protein [Clostridium frigidicarnis]|uniref:hypothetical protein n=1 Tax=Clostridium frigidicarnis TaxID=84698 RepID=UPI000B7F72F3|nr:hypothetical protein [Clostridium frigidicarnis]